MSDHSEFRGESDPRESAEERRRREEREDREGDRSFRRLGDQLLSNLIGEPTAAFKRGQDLFTEVAQGTKEELVRIFSQEVRGFLDKMDAADLVQEIVSGLVIEMKTEIRFRRSEDGRVEPDIQTSETAVRHEDEGIEEAMAPTGEATREPAPAKASEVEVDNAKEPRAEDEAEPGAKLEDSEEGEGNGDPARSGRERRSWAEKRTKRLRNGWPDIKAKVSKAKIAAAREGEDGPKDKED